MRVARPFVLALFLALALAPAASAHGDDDEPNHRDTPADLAAADIDRTLAVAHLARTVAPDLPQYLPTEWCGTPTTDDDSAHAAFPASQRQIKVVYAHAVDSPDRFALWQNALQTDVSRIQQFLALQTGGRRALRFDMGTDCGPQYVDIQVVHLPGNRSAYIGPDDEQNFNAVAAAVRQRVPQDSRDVFVFGDGLTDPAPGHTANESVWGIAQVPDDDTPGAANASNSGGRMAMMLAPPLATPDPWDWQPTVMLHEITHNLGGVQQSALHSTPFAHCWDGRDVMCYEDGSSGSQPYTTLRVRLRRRRDPADLRLRPRRLLQPRPGRGQLPGDELERLHERLHGLVRAAGDGVRRQHRPHRAGQHGAARGDRPRRSPAPCSARAPGRGSTARRRTPSSGSAPPAATGRTCPARSAPTTSPRAPTPASPCAWS